MKDNKRKGSRYWKLLAIFALFNVLVIILTVQFIYGRLLVYEAGTPNAALRQFFLEVTEGDFEAAKRDAGFLNRIQEEQDAFDRGMREIYYGRKPEDFNCRRIASNDPDGRVVYGVYVDGEKLGEIFMYSMGKAVDSIGSVNEFLETTEAGAVTWKIVPQIEFEYLPPVTISAPNTVEVYVNGRALEPADAIDVKLTEMSIFEWLPEGYSVNLPSTLTYKTESMLTEPEVTVQGLGATPEMSYNSERRHYEITSPENYDVTSAEWEEYSARMITIAKAYATFISEDGTLQTLRQYLYPNTDFAARMSGFDNQWYAAHSSYEFSGLEVKEISKYADDVFVGHMVFDYVVNFFTGQRTFPSDYTMLFVNSGGRWMLADLRVA